MPTENRFVKMCDRVIETIKDHTKGLAISYRYDDLREAVMFTYVADMVFDAANATQKNIPEHHRARIMQPRLSNNIVISYYVLDSLGVDTAVDLLEQQIRVDCLNIFFKEAYR